MEEVVKDIVIAMINNKVIANNAEVNDNIDEVKKAYDELIKQYKESYDNVYKKTR